VRISEPDDIDLLIHPTPREIFLKYGGDDGFFQGGFPCIRNLQSRRQLALSQMSAYGQAWRHPDQLVGAPSPPEGISDNPSRKELVLHET